MLRFRVPGSTTNLGHGFDCLGLALGCANVIAVEPGGDAVAAPDAPDGGLAAMAARVRDTCGRLWGRSLPGFTIRVTGDVPIARGLGSSSTIILGAAAACQELAGRPLDRDELVAIAADLEGHPDNAAAAGLGGFVVVGDLAGRVRTHRFPVPSGLVAVVAIPPFEVKTSEARRILPATLDRADHVRGLQGTALIVAALAAGNAQALTGCFDDTWHERHRASLNPGLGAARAAALGAGALGTILSGSGSTVLSFAMEDRAAAVRSALMAGYQGRADVRILAIADQGLSRLE